MSTDERIALLALPIVLLVTTGLAVAGSHYGTSWQGLPLFALLVTLAFLIQWLAFIPAYLTQSERFYDLTGSLTTITIILLALWLSDDVDRRALLLGALVLVWAFRLGSFLVARIRREGRDDRFREIKRSAIRFFLTWTMQGLWVSFTTAAALAAITATRRVPLDGLALVGAALWLTGFAIEVIADEQKRRFRSEPRNRGCFIQSGLWSRSRHPNYFGEIMLWFGVAIVALPVLRGWQLLTLLSPLFVALLLTRISGIPLLEARADERWGGDAAYERYKAETPVLIPRLP